MRGNLETGLPAPLDLPADRMATAGSAPVTEAVGRPLPPDLATQGDEVLLAGFVGYLSRITGATSVCVHLLDGGRDRSFSVEGTFADLQTRVATPEPHRLTPAEKATVAFVGRDASPKDDPAGYTWVLRVGPPQGDAALTWALAYDGRRFERASIEARLGELSTFLCDAVRRPETPVRELALLDDEARTRIVSTWNQTAAPFDIERTLPALLEAEAQSHLDACAIHDFEGLEFSYRAVLRRAGGVARRLRTMGVGRGDTVALAVARRADVLPAMVGIAATGAAYVPVAPDLPAERIRFMIEDAEVRVVVGHARGLGSFALPSLNLDEAVDDEVGLGPIEATPDDVAYVIYTSGSTGRPKGVMVPHRAVVNFLLGMRMWPGLAAETRLLATTTLSFDVSVVDLYLPWMVGGTVVMAPRRVARDGVTLAQALVEHDATAMTGTPATWRMLVEAGWEGRDDFKVLAAGEVFPPSLAAPLLARAGEVWNMYGPTEATVYATGLQITEPDARVTIGRPVPNASAFVLDPHGQLLPPQTPGELCLGGPGLARGYRGRKELTASRFVDNPVAEAPHRRLYRTGDRVAWTRDGALDYLGRLDDQVKVRGYRIELGEVEVALASHPDISRAAAAVREDGPGDKRLIGYFVPAGDDTPPVDALRRHLQTRLPEYMLPTAYVALPSLPLTPNGKVARRELPAPERARPELETTFAPPRSQAERVLAEVWAQHLQLDRVGIDDSFFDLGGTSLLAQTVALALQGQHGMAVSVVQMFQAPTVRGLAALLRRDDAGVSVEEVAARAARGRGDANEPIAVVAMAVRVPGAADPGAFWANLEAGVTSITHFGREGLDPRLDPQTTKDDAYVAARGVIEAETWDAGLFGESPRMAAVIDPQQRLMVELGHEVLERAGYARGGPAPIGVFAGVGDPTYRWVNVQARPDVLAAVGAFPAMVATDKDYVATRVAYKLDLVGPAVSVHTACSTSLVAVAQACDALRAYSCDAALAGGASVTVPQRQGYTYVEGGMLSPDGVTRSYDADGNGTVFCDGAVMVMLKRLSDAQRDGDCVHAVITGWATNNDGAKKASFTAPSVDGQTAVIALAQARAGVSARDISYVEGHGTATPLGDPIEVAALTRAFRLGTADDGFCTLGSVKSNVGHLVAAAGAAGLVKTVMALQREWIPPTAHFRRPNPAMDMEQTPFVVRAEGHAWPRDPSRPRRAGVSSFGVGGTNAHVIVEEAPEPDTRRSSPRRPRQVVLLSARSPAALQRHAENTAEAMAEMNGVSLADAAFTLHVGRGRHRERTFAVGGTGADVKPRLLAARGRACTRVGADVGFMFPGQGAQYVGMGRSLYRDEPIFRAALDRVVAIASPIIGRDLARVIDPRPDVAAADAAATLKNTLYTQPALFAVSYALASLWMSWGVRPSVMIGHSIGEFCAATLAGVMSVEDACTLVAHRGRLMRDLPGGSMLSVRAGADALESYLGEEIALGAANAPQLSVLSGSDAAIDRVRRRLEADGIPCKALHTSHAFHSPMMDPIVSPFAELVRRAELKPPRIPIISTVTGTLMRDDDATDPHYWARHLRAPVQFAMAVRALWAQDPPPVMLEVGPRRGCTTLALSQATKREVQVAIPSCGSTSDDEEEWQTLLGAVGALFVAGVELGTDAFWGEETRRRIVLPTYPYERTRHWLDPRRPEAK
ncbi:MAG: amino acid adenylation domain-containing protein, partial [Myxococcota bacterium]